MTALLALPTELLATIVSCCSDSTLSSLALTCRVLQTLAEARFYATVRIRGPSVIAPLAHALEQRPERFRAIKKLVFTPGLRSRHAIESVASMPVLTRRMARLKVLEVEAPMINAYHGWESSQWWGEISKGFVGLLRGAEGIGRHLTQFTFHSHGRSHRYINIDQLWPVFLSPTLEHVHLSCIDLSRAKQSFDGLGIGHLPRTPLQTLILQRCSTEGWETDNLSPILALPRALRGLSLLLDTPYDSLNSTNSISLTALPTTLLIPLTLQSSSLSYLRLGSSYTFDPRNQLEQLTPALFSNLAFLTNTTKGFSSFKALHTFAVDLYNPVAELLLDPNLAPPHLRTLAFNGLNFDTTWNQLPSFIDALTASTPFTELRLHTNPGRLDFAAAEKLLGPGTGARTSLLQVASIRAREMGVEARVRLVYAWQEHMWAQPPFLFGEAEPEEAVLFDMRGSKGIGENGEGADCRFGVMPFEKGQDVDGSGWEGAFCGLSNDVWRHSDME